MIIRGIHAENVLKYSQLKLDNLPEEGLVAIEGQNESGKSTIGETLCFALYGRTFSLDTNEIQKIIRWGENHCNVVLTFSVDGQDYELSRFLDADSNHSAKLQIVDSDTVLARGVDSVADAVYNLIGYEFEEFIESFYLAQREITTPHPHSQAVKIMAGVAPIEYVVDEIEQEIKEQKEMQDEVEAEIQDVSNEIEGLDMDDDRLALMKADLEICQEGLHHNGTLVMQLEDEANNYVQTISEAKQALSNRSISSFFRNLSLLLAVVMGAVWGALTHGMHLEQSRQLLELLQMYIPNWQEDYILWSGYVAATFGIIMILSWIRVAVLNSSIRQFKTDAARLAEVLAECRNVQIDFVDSEEEQEKAEQLVAEESDDALLDDLDDDGIPVRPDDAEYNDIHPRIIDLDASAVELRGYTETELAWLRFAVKHQELEETNLLVEVEDAETRLARIKKLEEIIVSLHEKSSDYGAKIELRTKAIELLEGASRHQSNNFNRDVRTLVGQTLPLFTNNRYEHLQIADDLEVKVFSAEKRDFMELEEVSSGAQRQIMLALRLALSQKLLTQAVKGKQFAFLDEPFAFFDEERTRNALTALAQFSKEITQIWIVGQSFPETEDVEFSVSISCARDQDALVSSLA